MSKTKAKIVNGVRLIQDWFGSIRDDNGAQILIKRFTWKNQNDIEVQLITYGATITSIKLPDRQKKMADVVLGFDDIDGYQTYSEHSIGATIGRFANKILNSTFHINKKQFQLSKNLDGTHHYNGGFAGFDKVVWEWHVKNNVVYLSHISPAFHEGYPGNLMVQIEFELTQCNEFKINISATTTAPTIINITNNVFFNLAGHGQGESELHKHTVILNANCHTPVDEQGFPTGKIINVTNTKFDFQTPKILKHFMKDMSGGEYDQNFCINRGVEQGDCFVGRVTHVPSGRVLEIYSNQSGVQFYTANRFSAEVVAMKSRSNSTTPSVKPIKSLKSLLDEDLEMIDQLHEYTLNTLSDDSPTYDELKELIKKIRSFEFKYECAQFGPPKNTPRSSTEDTQVTEDGMHVFFDITPEQLKYLVQMKMAVLQYHAGERDVNRLATIIEQLLSFSADREQDAESTPIKDIPSELQRYFAQRSNLEYQKRNSLESGKNSARSKDGKIHGKKSTIYERHGAFSLQTQNYPNAMYYNNFPKCVLNPGEKYCHTITYKFWIMDGYPNNWIKRDFFCPPYKYY